MSVMSKNRSVEASQLTSTMQIKEVRAPDKSRGMASLCRRGTLHTVLDTQTCTTQSFSPDLHVRNIVVRDQHACTGDAACDHVVQVAACVLLAHHAAAGLVNGPGRGA